MLLLFTMALAGACAAYAASHVEIAPRHTERNERYM